MALARGSAATSAVVARQRQNRWKAIAVLAIAVLVTTLDSSVMTVTTPTIQRSFGASLQALEWATTIYALLFGATMILWARLGKRYGQREIFILGIVLFGVSSLLVGLSSSIGVMVAMRALQAIGAAMINPAAIALVALMFNESERPLAYGINSTSASVGGCARLPRRRRLGTICRLALGLLREPLFVRGRAMGRLPLHRAEANRVGRREDRRNWRSSQPRRTDATYLWSD